MTNSKFIAMVGASVMAALLIMAAGVHSAWAHASTSLMLPSDATRGVKITIGETTEPVYIEGVHNLDFSLKDILTNLPITGAQTKIDGTQGIKVDSYFYPKGTTPSITGSDPGPYSAGAGYTDSRLNQNLRAQSGKPGFYQNTDQYYTKVGRTLYHIYGSINYYKDVELPIDIWVDGATVRTAHSGSTVLTFTGNFGLAEASVTYWPDADGGVTPDTYADNLKESVATLKTDVTQLKSDVAETKTNSIDIFNFLRGIAEGINQLLTSGTPITIPAAK